MSRMTHCPIFAECGLCSLFSISQEEEKNLKKNKLEHMIQHKIRFVESPKQLGYRNRISLRSDNQGRLGYHQPKSHQLIPISQCVIAEETINSVLSSLPPCPTPIQSIEFRSNGNHVVAQIYSPPKKTASAKKIRQWLSPFVDGIALDHNTIWGKTHLEFLIADVQHSFHPQSFFQVNQSINTLLVQEIIEKVHAINPTHILDLYAGAGNIGLALAQKGFSVTLMESAPTSCADARKAMKTNKLQATIIQAPVEDYIPGTIFFDLLILDPPRAGCGAKIKDFLLTKPRHVLYVSCHPQSLKKDASLLREEGYRIDDIVAFNMFPATEHIETLCSFVRDE